MDDLEIKWNAKHDAYRPTTEFTDLLRIVAAYYEMYGRAVSFVGPYISKQKSATIFIPPDKEDIKSAIGKTRSTISFRAVSSFVESLHRFFYKSKGKKALIEPSPTTHHSAQFPQGTFEITKVSDAVQLRDDKGPRQAAKNLFKIELFGADAPIYVENLLIPVDQVKFIIIRPKLGRLGSPSVSRWEVLFYRAAHGYIIDHVDSNLNPRWAGIM